MSQEDNELEKLKAKRLAEMEKNLSSQRQQKELQSSQEEGKKNQPTHREIVVKRLGLQRFGSVTKC
jgi:DNA-binding TFAR19-related protein (PDSD5 family)